MPKIKVCARFRPLSSKERSDHGDTVSLRAIDSKSFTLKDETEEEVEFRFDRVFYQGSGQDEIYEFLALPIVKGVVNGVNGAIITYGQTGAGKTYSMEGPSIRDSDEKQKGLLPRVVDGLFNNIKLSDEITECTIKLSMVEIYMERIRDLFDLSKDNLQIKESEVQGIFVSGVTEISISDSAEALRSLSTGIANTAVGETQMNMTSRSHCIYMFLIEMEVKKEKRSGKLILVDLAGSEKAETTGAEGRVLEEAKNINKSLTALGNVIYALTCGSPGGANHIPYRDSTLTQILRDALGGNSQTALLCCCSPSPSNVSESLLTLRFGARAIGMKTITRAIGIDLGTTYTRVGIWQDNHLEMLEKGTPSSVSFTNSGRRVDDEPRHRFTKNLALAIFDKIMGHPWTNGRRSVYDMPNYSKDIRNTVFDVKRIIGREFTNVTLQRDMNLWPFRVIPGPNNRPAIVVEERGLDRQFTTQEITSMILRKMKEIGEARFGPGKVKDAVISVPSSFTDSQRQATKDAGEMAGLNVMRIINETTAAAIAYGLDRKVTDDEKTRLMFHLGGGTVDVSLVTIQGCQFKVEATAGDVNLGGKDFDITMMNHFVREFKTEQKMDISGNPIALQKLLIACEKAKRALSFTEQTIVHVNSLHNGVNFTSPISRAMFEELNKDHFNRCIRLIKDCLRMSCRDTSIVEDIVLVGGSTRIPKIQQLLREFFDRKELCKTFEPDYGVARGAAIIAATLSGQCNGSFQPFIRDINPFPFSWMVEGEIIMFGKIAFDSSTEIPILRRGQITTRHKEQSDVVILVSEGNRIIRRYIISGIVSKLPRFIKIILCCYIDENGILNVLVEEPVQGNGIQVTCVYEGA